MNESKKSQPFKFRALILLIVPAGFQSKGGMAADAVKVDSPDSRGGVIGNEGDPEIEADPAGYAPPSGLIVMPTAALSAEFGPKSGYPLYSIHEWHEWVPNRSQSLSPFNPGTQNRKPTNVPGFPYSGRNANTSPR